MPPVALLPMVRTRLGSHSSKGRVPHEGKPLWISQQPGTNGAPKSPLSTGAVEILLLVARRHCIFTVLAVHGGWCAVVPDTQGLT